MATKRAVYQIADFKAVNGASGEFEALVSVFGNVDLQGDRVNKGAFTKSLDEWRKSGDPIPIIWSHQWDNPNAHIGYATSATETDRGLLLKGKNDIDKPFAAQVHDLLVQRRVKNWSFAYDVINEHRAKDGANELDELGLIEAGPTLKGANSDTDTINAKALLDEAAAKEHALNGTKAGRRLSQATRTRLQSMRDELDTLLADDANDEVDDEPKNATADADNGSAETQIEADGTKTQDDQEPSTARLPCAEDLQLRSLIAEMSATVGRDNGSDST